MEIANDDFKFNKDIDLDSASAILDKKLDETNQRIAKLTHKVDQLTDEEFFNELSKLREEHQRTLEICEKLYSSKNSNHKKSSSSHCGFTHSPSLPSDEIAKTIVEMNSMDNNNHDFSDGFLKLPPKQPKRDRQADTANLSIGRDWDNFSLKSHSQSLDFNIRKKVKDAWRKLENSSETDYATIATRPWSAMKTKNSSLPTRKSSSHQKQFHHDNCMSMDNHNNNDDEDYSESWRHRITIPKPFSMTIREEQAAIDASKKPKTTSMVQLERELEEKAKLEEEKLKKGRDFRAKPIPSHVYLPLYENLQEQQRARREFLHNYTTELLKAQEKPFQFYLREREKERLRKEKQQQRQNQQQQQQHNANTTNNNLSTSTTKQAIRPKEIPKSHYENKSERLKEDELLRQVMARMRAEKLLQIAKEPEGMKQRRLMKLAKEKQQQENNGQNSDKQQSNVKKVPDFEKIHWKFEQTIRQSRPEIVNTKPKPFSLRTASRSLERKPKSNSNGNNNGLLRQSSMESFKRRDHTRALMSALELAEPCYTNSHVLRQSKTKDKQRWEEEKQEEKIKEEMHKKRKNREIGKSMRESFDIVNPHQSVDMETRIRKERLKQGDHQRSKDYQEQIREMNDRVKNRPLLIHQQQALMAKIQAEKKYQQVLSSAGLSNEFVESKGKNFTPETLTAWPANSRKASSVDRQEEIEKKRLEFGDPNEPLEVFSDENRSASQSPATYDNDSYDEEEEEEQ